MKILANIIARLVNWAMRENSNSGADQRGEIKPMRIHQTTNSIPSSLNLNVTFASGGKVVVVRHYDEKTDRSRETVYIVTDAESLGQQLEHIITIENLHR